MAYHIPKYNAVPVPARYMIVKSFFTFLIAIILYLMLFANRYIFSSSISSSWYWILAILLAIALSIEIVYSYVKYSQYRYIAYDDVLQFRGMKTINIRYSDISNISIKENILDMPFHTGTIILTLKDKNFKIAHILHADQFYYILQKMK